MIPFMFFFISLLFFVTTMCRQVYIIFISPKNDPYLITKVLFLLFNFFVVSSVSFLYLGSIQVGLPCFFGAAIIGFWTYFIDKPIIEF